MGTAKSCTDLELEEPNPTPAGRARERHVSLLVRSEQLRRNHKDNQGVIVNLTLSYLPAVYEMHKHLFTV
jgi:hypothetical protein